jgi:hypothetical protein
MLPLHRNRPHPGCPRGGPSASAGAGRGACGRPVLAALISNFQGGGPVVSLLVRGLSAATPIPSRQISSRSRMEGARSARPPLTHAIMANRAVVAEAEIATLRQQLAAAQARIREIEDEDNMLKPLRKRLAALNCDNPTNPVFAESETEEVQGAARVLGVRLLLLNASNRDQISMAFESIAREQPAALAVSADLFFLNERAQIVTLAAHHGVPAIYGFHEQATAGGLMSYGFEFVETNRLTGVYTGRVLNGERPAKVTLKLLGGSLSSLLRKWWT